MRKPLSVHSPRVALDVPLAPLTTLAIGGPARHFIDIHHPDNLELAYRWREQNPGPVLYLGEGSNVLFSDEGFPGLVVRSRINSLARNGNIVEVGAGHNLPALLRWLNLQGLAGMERMYGIPGTVAGALVGNAGAYGQEICETVIDVTVCSPDGMQTLGREALGFSYRNSLLKTRRDLFLVTCRLRLQPSPQNLQEISDAILSQRLQKYPPNLCCPGSFFKNVVASELPEEVRCRIPAEFVMFGKIPAGKLLEAVGAKGKRRGGAGFASYHGNLLINFGEARAVDVLGLAADYATRVHERFGVRLEPEIHIVDRKGNLLTDLEKWQQGDRF